MFVHEEAPNEIFVLPAFAEASDLQEEDAVVVEHVVDLFKESREMPHADMLGHLETGDFAVATFRNRDIAVVHAKDAALILFDTGFPHSVVSEGGLVSAEGHTSGTGAVVNAGIFGQRPPSTANVEQGFARFEADLLANDSEFVVLELLQGFFDMDVGDYS